jgi:hypothetical protein
LKEETMANGTRPVVLVLTLVVGLAVGWLIHSPAPTPPPPPPPPPTAPVPSPVPTVHPPYVTPPGPYPHAKNWDLTVGPDACDVTENGTKVPVAVISKQGRFSIRYHSDAGQVLGILFHVPGPVVQPFKNVALVGRDSDGNTVWALVCDPTHKSCATGPANMDAIEDKYIKTDQILDGTKCDAGIIIEK